MIKVDYKLRGVANTRFRAKLTNRTLEECAARRLTVTWQNGKAQLAVTKPTSENSEELRRHQAHIPASAAPQKSQLPLVRCSACNEKPRRSMTVFPQDGQTVFSPPAPGILPV